MDIQHIRVILYSTGFLMLITEFSNGQSVTLTGPLNGAIENGSDTVYTCTGGEAPYIFIWEDLSVGTGVNIFIAGEVAYDPLVTQKYVNFDVSEIEGASTMTILNTLIEDEGQYRCTKGTGNNNDAELTVEVNPTQSLSVESTIESNLDMYVATCEALDGRPEVTMAWMFKIDDGPSPCDDPVVTYPDAAEGLSSTRSVCTFQATSENNGETLKCVITGHLVSELNGEKTFTLPMHSAPSADIMTVEIQFLDPSYRVSCNISEADQPNPRIRNYYIYSDSTLIHQSSTGVNFVDVPESEYDLSIVFNCVAENYLGSTTTYPPSTTTLTPTTMAEHTTEGNTATMPGLPTTQPSMTTMTSEPGTPAPKPPIGPIIGGVVAAIVIIVIIVIAVCYCKTQERFCFEAGGTPAPSNKPSGRAVGSSNGSGSEKDVESPLNGVKDVTAEEKLPQAAPRGHGSIQHTNDNPDQAMYAMVDKKPARGGGGGAGDAPDRGSGPGQNEPQGMLYADLDLSHKAGHTDKHVPKNENDVVVYSSILV